MITYLSFAVLGLGLSFAVPALGLSFSVLGLVFSFSIQLISPRVEFLYTAVFFFFFSVLGGFDLVI